MECVDMTPIANTLDTDDFIKAKRIFLQSFCEGIGWKYPPKDEKLTEESVKTPNSNIHTRNQDLKRRNDEDDDNFPEYISNKSDVAVYLSMEDIQEILSKITSHRCEGSPFSCKIPQSSFELQATFKPSERLAIYNHVTAVTASLVKTLPLSEIDLAFERMETGLDLGAEKSFHDLKSEERDLKRRRINYKQAKKVHTSNKSYTEVLAEVISNQMEMYMEWLQETVEENASCAAPSHPAEKLQTESSTSKTPKLSEYSTSRKQHTPKKRDRERSRSPRRHDRKSHKKHKERDRSRSQEEKKRHSKRRKHKRSRS